MLVVNGEAIPYGDRGMISKPDTKNGVNVSEMLFKDVRVRQTIGVVTNSATGRDDVVEIRYHVKNESGKTVSFGLRIMLDTMLGENDSAPFRVPGTGDLTTEREYSGKNIPQYFQAFDSLTSPKVVSYGSFVAGEIMPSRVPFTNWARVYDEPWGYQVNPSKQNGDSAVSAIWDEHQLVPNKEEEYVIRYGLSELLQDLRPPLGLTVTSDAKVQIDKKAKDYRPYTITAYVQNLSNVDIENVQCTFTLPSEMKFQKDTETGVVYVGKLAVGESRLIEKTVLVTTRKKTEYTTSYTVTATAAKADTKQLTKKVVVPPLSKAIIIVPGIAGSRLYADQKIDSVRKYWDWKLYDPLFPKDYSFEKGHQLWEPETSMNHGQIESATTYQDKIQSEVLMMLCDEAGESVISIKTDAPGKKVYGAQDTYKKLVQGLVNEFDGDEYDVQFFSYDWRMSNVESGKKLETFINDQQYTEVTLVCHSMGGLVASEYLRRSEDNRNLINKVITLGTPYLGAPKALYVLETGNFLDALTNTFCMSTPLKLVANNVYGIYQLLPDEQYHKLNSTTYVQKIKRVIAGRNRHHLVMTDTERLGYTDAYSLLANRDWARTSKNAMKPMYSTANSFYSGLMPNGDHIINSVDSYLVVGYGKDTIMEVKETYNGSGDFTSCDGTTVLNGGDGTVPMISATIGGKNPKGRTYYVEEEHAGLVKNDDVIKLVKNIINGDSAVPKSISKTQPTKLTKEGWFGTTQDKRIKLKLACPVNLTVSDPNGEMWAYVSSNMQYVADSSKGSVYVMGEDNEVKEALLIQQKNDVLLTCIDDGTMDYTVSLMDKGRSIKQILFRDVDVKKGMLIHSDTEVEGAILLHVDQDGDGDIDYVIEPTEVRTGDDLHDPDYDFLYTHSKPVFQWSSDLNSCDAYFTYNGGKDNVTLPCDITTEIKQAATHTTAGVELVTASITVGDDTYTDTRERSIPVVPMTGDNSNMPLMMVILMMSVLGLAVLAIRGKGAKQH